MFKTSPFADYRYRERFAYFAFRVLFYGNISYKHKKTSLLLMRSRRSFVFGNVIDNLQ